LYRDINVALVCSAELTRSFISYDIQTLEELAYKAAGLTIGNSAAAWLVRREPFGAGCLKLLAMSNYSLPGHWHLCSVPINGTFTSHSRELFKLGAYVPQELQRLLDKCHWSVKDVDHYVFHQPSDKMVKRVLKDLGEDPDKAVCTHQFYGNTSSTTVALAMHHLLKEREIKPGAKLVLGSAAAGFSMVTAAGTWVV
jgi:3-oxoacyl-[acyl-carrier-protein] synthase III